MVSAQKALELKDVYARYGIVPVLNNVSLHVKQREIVTLLGANASGKTTIVRTIFGVLPPIKGEVFFAGRRIDRLTPEKIAGLGIGYVPQGMRLFAPMTVMDNLILGAYVRYRRGEKEQIKQDFLKVFEIFPVLEKLRKRLAGSLSGGEQQMLAIGRGLMCNPRLLLLDEPSFGLAPVLISEMMPIIAGLRDRELSVFIVAQNARAALRIADRGYVLEAGVITKEGTAEQLLSDEAVRLAYLGGRPG